MQISCVNALTLKCAEYALEKGIIIRYGYQFEFSLDENGNIVLGDEIFDSDGSVSGRHRVTRRMFQPSSTKQFAVADRSSGQ